MKNLFALTLIGSSLILGSNPARADWDNWGTIRNVDWGDLSGIKFHTINSKTGTSTLRTSKCFSTNTFPDTGQSRCS